MLHAKSIVSMPGIAGARPALMTTGTLIDFTESVQAKLQKARAEQSRLHAADTTRMETTIEERQTTGRELSRKTAKMEKELILQYPDAVVIGLTTRPLLSRDMIRVIPGIAQPETLYTCQISSSKGCRTDQKSTASGTLNDPAMGAHRKGGECHQFQCTDCPGHFGYHKLPEPIVHPFFLGVVLQILGVICADCFRPLFTDATLMEVLKKTPKMERLNLIQETIGKGSQNGITCPHTTPPPHLVEESRRRGVELQPMPCGPPRRYLIKESQDSTSIYYRQTFDEIKQEEVDGETVEEKTKRTDRNTLSVEELINILSKISETDAELMGLNREYILDGYILHGIPILPPSCRPPPSYAGQEGTSEHPFTKAINLILTESEGLAEAKKNSNSHDKADRHQKLYSAIREYFIMLVKSLSGKEGFARAGTTAKRGDHAARAVIGPADPSTPLGWIEVPEYIAKKARISEDVTPDNIKVLQRMMRQGKIHQVVTASGVVKTVVSGKLGTIHINIGDKVERAAEHGDQLVLNRAPSIQQQSISGHRSLIVKNRSTLGIPNAVLPPKGADHDGDEMSLWFAQSMKARAEVRKLMDLRRNIISSQTSTPITGLILNSLTLLYELTKDTTFVNRKTFYDCLMLMRQRDQLKTFNERLANAKVHPLSGKALFSALLPAGFNYNLNEIGISDGILVEGQISGLTVGAGKGRSIIHMLWHFYGFERTATFISDTAYVLDRWNLDYGFSLTLDDFIHANDPESIKQIDNLYEAAQRYYEDIGLDATDIDLMNATRHVSNVGVDVLEDDNRRRAEKLRRLSIMTKEESNVSLLEAAIDKLVESDSLKQVLKDVFGPLYQEDFPKTIPVLSKVEVLSTLFNIIKEIFAEDIVRDVAAITDEEFLLHYFRRLGQQEDKMKLFVEMIQKTDFTIPHQQRLISAIKRNFTSDALAEVVRQLILPLRNGEFSKTFYMLTRGDMLAVLTDLTAHMFRHEDLVLPGKRASFEEVEAFLIQYMSKIVGDADKTLRFQSELYKEMEVYSRAIFDIADAMGTSEQNAMLLMSKKKSGAKGTAGNLGEIFGPKGLASTSEGCLERNIPGNRISNLFAPEDPSLSARGYCRGNYMRGQGVEESISHAIASREPQAHSSTLLPELGFTRRQLARALENLVIENGTQVIDKDTKMLVQTVYGGDGFLPQELMNVNGRMTFIDIESFAMQINTEFGWVPDFKPDPKVFSDEHDLYPSFDIGERPRDVFDIEQFSIFTDYVDDEEDTFTAKLPLNSLDIAQETGWDLTL